MFRKKEGFTLVELLVVIAIIAVLATIALFALTPAQRSGRDARRVADLRQVQSLLQLYYSRCGFYPGPSAPAGNSCPGVNVNGGAGYIAGSTPVWDGVGELDDVLATSGFIPSANSLPKDPSAGRVYTYMRDAFGTEYVLRAQLEVNNNNILGTDVDGNNTAKFADGSNRDLDCEDSPNNYYCAQL